VNAFIFRIEFLAAQATLPWMRIITAGTDPEEAIPMELSAHYRAVLVIWGPAITLISYCSVHQITAYKLLGVNSAVQCTLTH
jgi:hypothetical protein